MTTNMFTKITRKKVIKHTYCSLELNPSFYVNFEDSDMTHCLITTYYSEDAMESLGDLLGLHNVIITRKDHYNWMLSTTEHAFLYNLPKTPFGRGEIRVVDYSIQWATEEVSY